MGTLVFHILLFLLFYMAGIDLKRAVQEEALLIEFPDLPALPPEIPDESDDQPEDTPAPNEASAALSRQESNQSNRPSNRLARQEEFFDNDYLREVEAARQLVANVNNQLSKETVKLEDIEMPVQSTEGMDPETIKNVIYTGKSNIVYYLENRYHLRLPIPVYLAQGGGVVVVDIAVNRQGKVIEATPRNNPAIRDEQIFLYAKAAAIRTLFNEAPEAPNPQRGTIHYTFVQQ